MLWKSVRLLQVSLSLLGMRVPIRMKSMRNFSFPSKIPYKGDFLEEEQWGNNCSLAVEENLGASFRKGWFSRR